MQRTRASAPRKRVLGDDDWDARGARLQIHRPNNSVLSFREKETGIEFPPEKTTKTESFEKRFPAMQNSIFPPIKFSSELQLATKEGLWLWDGCLPVGGTTLLSALSKAGKTTLLSLLLREAERGGVFCGRAVKPCRVLYVSEEAESRWAERRDAVGLGDHVSFVCRPFLRKPTMNEWSVFLGYLRQAIDTKGFNVVVFDTLASLWPVRDENDAGQVCEAFLPIQGLGDGVSKLLVHHLKKSDGREGTGSRGSGALTAAVDVILELRRASPDNQQDRQRILRGYGRWDNVLDEVMIELNEDGNGYSSKGDRVQAEKGRIFDNLFSILPKGPPGMTDKEIIDAWPNNHRPRRALLLDVLRDAAGKKLVRDGAGKKGAPFRYRQP